MCYSLLQHCMAIPISNLRKPGKKVNNGNDIMAAMTVMVVIDIITIMSVLVPSVMPVRLRVINIAVSTFSIIIKCFTCGR